MDGILGGTRPDPLSPRINRLYSSMVMVIMFAIVLSDSLLLSSFVSLSVSGSYQVPLLLKVLSKVDTKSDLKLLLDSSIFLSFHPSNSNSGSSKGGTVFEDDPLAMY